MVSKNKEDSDDIEILKTTIKKKKRSAAVKNKPTGLIEIVSSDEEHKISFLSNKKEQKLNDNKIDELNKTSIDELNKTSINELNRISMDEENISNNLSVNRNQTAFGTKDLNLHRLDDFSLHDMPESIFEKTYINSKHVYCKQELLTVHRSADETFDNQNASITHCKVESVVLNGHENNLLSVSQEINESKKFKYNDLNTICLKNELETDSKDVNKKVDDSYGSLNLNNSEYDKSEFIAEDKIQSAALNTCDNFEEVKNFFQNRESTTEKLSAKNTILMPETANFSEKTKIILRSDDEERVFYVGKDDTFADILEEADLVKIKYNGIPVSKYLTLEEIGFVENNPYFELIDTTCSDINLKVNVDFYACKNILISKNKKVSDILERCGKSGIIVMNGIIIDLNKKIKEVLENDDVIDVIDL